jgi:fructose-1,6-bisphosphatase/inositol monophosphatase family enzyme
VPVADVAGLLRRCAAEVAAALERVEDRAAAGDRSDQYALDLVADEAALAVLDAEGVGVLSEESGATGLDRDLVVVVDPVDGSANASRSLPLCAASLCAVDRDGPVAALVVDLATGRSFEAARGAGAWSGGARLRVSGCRSLAGAFVALSGPAPAGRPWAGMRALGAAALELAHVAAGGFDAYVNTDDDHHGVWDYLAGALLVEEAGGVVADAGGRPLAVLDPAARRSPVAAATEELLGEVLALRRGPAVR